jgi:hypothetical protein
VRALEVNGYELRRWGSPLKGRAYSLEKGVCILHTPLVTAVFESGVDHLEHAYPEKVALRKKILVRMVLLHFRYVF